jgi:hypothetical protein
MLAKVMDVGGAHLSLMWDLVRPEAGTVELGHHCDGRVRGVAVVAGARVVAGGNDGRVLVWDPARPGTDPAELGPRRLGAGGSGAG